MIQGQVDWKKENFDFGSSLFKSVKPDTPPPPFLNIKAGRIRLL